MSKMTVKEYIEKYTRRCSNELDAGSAEDAIYMPWLTPSHAEAVAQIAREETIEEACEWLSKHAMKYNSLGVDELVKDLKVAMDLKRI